MKNVFSLGRYSCLAGSILWILAAHLSPMSLGADREAADPSQEPPPLTVFSPVIADIPQLEFAPANSTSAHEPLVVTELAIAERDAHQQKWTYSTRGIDEAGREQVNARSFVQLETGLNRWAPNENAWVPASANIEIVNGKGIIRNAQWSAIIAGNANDPEGALDLLTPDGTRAVFQTIGLAYTDDTGQSVFIAELQNSEGKLTDDQTVIFPDALSGEGGLKADLRIKTSLGGIENDLILRQALPAPEVYGLDSAKTHLEAWHEIINRAKPGVEKGAIRRSEEALDTDDQLHFGSMLIGRGNAFNLGQNDAEGAPIPLGDAVAVSKEYAEIDGMSFLIERIPYEEAKPFLRHLPAPAQALRMNPSRLDGLKKAYARANGQSKGNRRRPLVLSDESAKSGKPKPERMMAALTRGSAENGPGFLIDFAALVSATNFTFEGSTTYYVSGDVTLSGLTVIEGGSVTKFSNNAPSITMTGTLLCKTTPWLPAVFTAKDADEVGETITSSTGNPTGTYALRALKFYNSNPSQACGMHDLRIAFAQYGLSVFSGYDNDLRNLQIVKCKTGIELGYSYARVRNALIHKADNYVLYGNNAKFVAEHLTARAAGNFLYNTTSSFYVTNSLLAAVTNVGSYTGTNNMIVSNDTFFASMAQGANYNTFYRDGGTTNISYLSEILKMTTFPPVLITGNLSGNTTLIPVVQRDADVAPDVGYHYPPLDYVLSNVTLSASSTLLCTNGVKIAYCGTNGLYFTGSGIRFVSEGKPEDLNRIVRTETVQEQPISIGIANSFANFAGSPSSPTFNLAFTGVSALAPQRNFLLNTVSATAPQVSFSHSFFSTIAQSLTDTIGAGAVYALTNNIFERSIFSLYTYEAPYYLPSFYAYNNLWFQCNFGVFVSTNTTWTFRDNLIYGSTLSFPWGGTVTASNNGYKSGLGTLGGSSNVTVYAANFVSGPLGPYYYPTSGTNLYSLVNAGSRTADSARLYHFTCWQDETKETNGAVDIGAHYATVSTPRVRFIGTDNSTQGNWPGLYGRDGYTIIQYTVRTPPDFESTITGSGGWVWAASPTDAQSLQRGDGTGRIAACWYTATTMDLAFTQTDGIPRRFSAYVLDYDGASRSETLEIRDTVTGTVLDSQTATGFSGGRYYTWEIVGNATLRITRNSGVNAVISGFFLDPGGSVAATDSDSDGFPDYLEDRNGNGALDSGEMNPNSSSDLGLKVLITRPKAGASIP